MEIRGLCRLREMLTLVRDGCVVKIGNSGRNRPKLAAIGFHVLGAIYLLLLILFLNSLVMVVQNNLQ